MTPPLNGNGSFAVAPVAFCRRQATKLMETVE